MMGHVWSGGGGGTSTVNADGWAVVKGGGRSAAAAAAERRAAERKEAERRAAERLAAERLAAEQQAAEQKVAEQKAAQQNMYATQQLMSASIAQQREAWRAFVDEMARSAPGGEGALYGALSIVKTRDKPSGWFSPCVVAPSGAHVPGRGMRVDMVARAPAFREQVLALGIGRYHGSDELRPAKQFDSLDALFVHVKSAENACNVVLANGPTLAALRETLARDGERAQLLPVRVTEAELAELHASALGFRAIGQRSAVYAWEFAREIGGLTPAHVEALFGLGVDTLDAVDEALARHEDEHKLGPMRDDAQVLIDFLEDEREARAKRTTILRLRADREALALRQAAEAARAHREAEMRRAAEDASLEDDA
jgi:hypothetical protein